MTSQNLLSFVTLSLCLSSLAIALPHRRAAQTLIGTTPIMGYNTYNAIHCSPTQDFSQGQINDLVANGFVAAGYKMFMVDCGWQAPDGSRNATNGAIAQDLNAFPAGLNGLSTYATSRGMDFGTYTDEGVYACGTGGNITNAGSLGHEQADANWFKSINATYVKVDNCWPDANTEGTSAPQTNLVSKYSNMTFALRNAGIDASLTCEWGAPYENPDGIIEGPVSWTKNISTSFRLSDDVSNDYDAIQRIYNEAIYVAHTGLTGPGFHGDADLLETGNKGLTFAQEQTQFAYWSMVKSALIISTDVSQLSSDETALLQNSDLIAINQDSLGEPVKLVQRFTNDYDVHAGPLSNGDMAVLGLNMQDNSRSLTIDFSLFNVTSADVKDLLTGTTQSGVSSYTATVDADAPIALRLSNVQTTVPSTSVTWTQATSGTTTGSADQLSCPGCSEGQKVGNIGGSGDGSLTLTNIEASSSTATLLFDYLNCQNGYLYQVGANQRTAEISVNGGSNVTVSFPLSGYNWLGDVWKNYRVQLSGFNTGSGNTITITGSGNGAYGPDFDRVGVLSS